MTTESPAPPAAPQRKRNWVPIIIIVVVLVVIVAGVVAWRVRSNDSTDKVVPAGQTAKGLYKAWQAGNRNAAAKYANAASVDKIFVIQKTEASGLQFGGCTPTGNGPFPKECVWTRPGGELTMTLNKSGDTVTVTNVKFGPAGTPPASNG
jgi:hypothetical protein